MRKVKISKAITLISLIITIIIILILLSITINVFLGQDGLMGKAREANNRYQYAIAEEKIISQIEYINEGPNSGGVNLEKTKENIDKLNLKEIDGETQRYEDKIIVLLKNGERIIINKGGKISKTEIKNGTTYTHNQVLSALEITENKGTYQGDWTVIGVEGQYLKLASNTNVSNNYSLGVYGNLERSTTDYKNLVSKLEQEVVRQTGIESARSIKINDIYEIIGEENVNKEASSRYGMIVNYFYNATEKRVYSKTKSNAEGTFDNETDTKLDEQKFLNNNLEEVTVNSAGKEVTLTSNAYRYTLTEEQKTKIGILANEKFWLADHAVTAFKEYAQFGIFALEQGKIDTYSLFNSKGRTFYNPYAPGVRAVVLIPIP